MGVGISTKGGAVTPAWFYNRPFIRLTLMPVTQSLVNTYSCVKRVFHSCHGEPSEDKILILILALSSRKNTKLTAQSLTPSHWYPACFDHSSGKQPPLCFLSAF